MEYVAHVRQGDRQVQSVKTHLLEVRELAETYGAKIGVKHIAGLAGVLHDLGKYTTAFQDYIWEAVNNPDSPPKRGSVDHSTAGGKLLYERYHQGRPSAHPWILAEVVGNAILSHHSYLQDFIGPELESAYLTRVCDKKSEELKEFERTVDLFFANVMSESEFQIYVDQAIEELKAYLLKPSPMSDEGKLMFLTKFVFSALIDADRTNTRLFEENKPSEPERDRSSELFATYYRKLMDKIDSFKAEEDAQSPINRLRREMSDRCEEYAKNPSGIYSLSIPTGGGKTLASLRYALQHSQAHGKKRIIYVVPYTTIIEQNAAEIRKILADEENVLEHHSNVIEDANDDDENQDGAMSLQQKWKLARDNWDAPIIFTTMVQFLNVFYAKGGRNIRRLHNLTESVVIFDEVQKVPVPCVSLFNHALNFISTYGQSSLILCTATQPALNFVEHKLEIASDAEIVEHLDDVIEAFKRVEIIDRATQEAFDTEKLAEFVMAKLGEVQSVLVVLNTRTVVKKLYRQLEPYGVQLYHLSTSMCAAHRKHILDLVKEHLDRKEKVVCVSTQLIEAGVDISFDCVVRSLAGLDSIAQAAGRCNRHGKSGIREVYVVNHEEENLGHLPEIKKGKEISRKILIDLQKNPSSHGGHLLSRQAMEWYFQELYDKFDTNLNYWIPKLRKNMLDLIMMPRRSHPYFKEYMSREQEEIPLFLMDSHRTAAEYFQVIEDQTTQVIVPYGEEGREIIADLGGDESIELLSLLLRKAQQYTVNMFRHERDQLARNGGLVSLLDGKIMAITESAYTVEYGLDLENESPFELGIY